MIMDKVSLSGSTTGGLLQAAVSSSYTFQKLALIYLLTVIAVLSCSRTLTDSARQVCTSRMFERCSTSSSRTLQTSLGSGLGGTRSGSTSTASNTRQTATDSNSESSDTPAGVLIGVGCGVLVLIVAIIYCVSKRKQKQPAEPPVSTTTTTEADTKLTVIPTFAESNFFYGEAPIPMTAIFSTDEAMISNIEQQVMGLGTPESGRDSPCPPMECFEENVDIEQVSPYFTVMNLYNKNYRLRQNPAWATTQAAESESIELKQDEIQASFESRMQPRPYKPPHQAHINEYPETIPDESVQTAAVSRRLGSG